MKINFKKLALVSFVSSSALLAACGGDPSLTVSGTAATGLAVVGTVTATCKSGSGTASSNASGSYTVTITNGEGPCLIKLVSGTTTLYSVSSGTGATQIANVTPLTNLFVTYLLNAGTVTVPTAEDWFAANTTFLASTPSVTAQVANFIPFVQAYALTLPGAPVIVVPTTFLSTVFAAGAAPTANADDEALEALGDAGVWDATGTPDADVITAVVTETEQTVLTVLTGTTGAGG